MNEDRTISTTFDTGATSPTPQQIAGDPMLSNVCKIELLKSLKEHHAAPKDRGVLRDADLELEKLLELDSIANQN